jgi:hypothetical protein
MMWFDKEKVTVPIVFGFRITCHRVDDLTAITRTLICDLNSIGMCGQRKVQ